MVPQRNRRDIFTREEYGVAERVLIFCKLGTSHEETDFFGFAVVCSTAWINNLNSVTPELCFPIRIAPE